MIKDYFKRTFRNLIKNKVITLINLSGIVIGISSFILILLYVHQELTYDRFHANYDRIYKISIAEKFNTMAPLAVILKDKVPEIEKIVRVDYFMGGGTSPLLKFKKGEEIKTVQAKDIIYADSTFFDVFSFKVIQGDIKTSLTEPNSIVLTKSTAHKIFENENPIGKTIEFIGTNENPKLNYTVSAIIEDIPNNSSIKFNGIVSFNTLKTIQPGGVDVDEDFGNWTYETYVLMRKYCSVKELTQKSNEIWMNEIFKMTNYAPDSEEAQEYISNFVPLKDVNFYKNNKMEFICLILLVGIIIIVIAIINFVNISIAKASMRTKEIGVKKISGSSRYDLIKQFIGETIALTLIATLLALIVVYLLLPLFSDVTGKAITINFPQYPTVILLFIIGAIIIGIIAGIYPALYLSSFKPIAILKNEKISGKSKTITQSLIIFQFVISIALITSTIFISKQVKYMRTGDVGFDKNNIITCQITKSIKKNYIAFKHALLQNSNILNVAGSSGGGLSEQFHMSFTDKINGREQSFYAMAVDPDFIKTIGFNIIEGRDFSWDLKTDKYKTVIINETASKSFGLDDPLGFELELFDSKANVVGVVKDFHNESFHNKIFPLVFWCVPGYGNSLSIRINNNNKQETIQHIKKQWEEFSPEIPFDYQFLDKKYDALYKDEEKVSLLIGYFSIIAILIACLGLFGLVTFSTERRKKEIGIRKVNGAKVSEILTMLNIDFMRWIVIAFVIATPIAYYSMKYWLENFAYKTNLSWWIFALAGLLALGIALLTVSWQSWKAATRNPVEALRYE